MTALHHFKVLCRIRLTGPHNKTFLWGSWASLALSLRKEETYTQRKWSDMPRHLAKQWWGCYPATTAKGKDSNVSYTFLFICTQTFSIHVLLQYLKKCPSCHIFIFLLSWMFSSLCFLPKEEPPSNRSPLISVWKAISFFPITFLDVPLLHICCVYLENCHRRIVCLILLQWLYYFVCVMC